MRKLLLALGCLFFMTGLVIAGEVTLKKYDKDKKEVTVTDDKDKEATYKITDKTKVTMKDKDGNTKEAKFENVEKLLANEKAIGKLKFDITTEKDEVVEMKMTARKKN